MTITVSDCGKHKERLKGDSVKTYLSSFARVALVVLAAGMLITAMAGCTPATTVTVSPTVTLTSTLPETKLPPPPSTAAPTLRALRLIPPVPYNLLIGFTIPFVATGVYTDQSFKDVSDIVTWTSSDPKIASFDKLGVLTGISSGTVTVSCSLGSINSQTAEVRVVIPGART
jgi:hypothetical protein